MWVTLSDPTVGVINKGAIAKTGLTGSIYSIKKKWIGKEERFEMVIETQREYKEENNVKIREEKMGQKSMSKREKSMK